MSFASSEPLIFQQRSVRNLYRRAREEICPNCLTMHIHRSAANKQSVCSGALSRARLSGPGVGSDDGCHAQRALILLETLVIGKKERHGSTPGY